MKNGGRNTFHLIKRAVLPAAGLLIIANFMGYAIVGENGILQWGDYRRMKQERSVELARLLEQVGHDDSIRALVLTGAGDRAFVAGTDISQFQTFTDPQHAIEYEHRLDEVFATIEALPRPTIAMIRGYAVGGGASIAPW